MNVKIKIDGETVNCKIVASYSDGTVRIEYPVYLNGIYNGYIAKTVSKDEILRGWRF